MYANVSDALCFIDYATKCVMGQDADYYGLQGCQRWAKRTYCELQNSLQQYTDLASAFLIRNFVIEGVACQPPARRLQATPQLQTSLLIT